jgi:co-chaperonin GroES (HSP10)
VNRSGIVPVGFSILVKPDDIEEATESGIIVHSHTQMEREEQGQTDGIVIAMGPNVFIDEKAPRCKVGDRVVFTKYAGMVRQGLDGCEYRLMNDSDIKALLEKE